jgi:hypothetical protein
MNDRDPDAAYWRRVTRTRDAILAGDWPRVAAVQAELPAAVEDALAALTPEQLHTLV